LTRWRIGHRFQVVRTALRRLRAFCAAVVGRSAEGWRTATCSRSGALLSHRHTNYPGLDGPPWRADLVIHPGAAAAALHHAGRDVVITGDCYELDLVRSVAQQAGLPESAVLAGTLRLLLLITVSRVLDATQHLLRDCGWPGAVVVETRNVLDPRWSPTRV
jgi:hypothetical protein